MSNNINEIYEIKEQYDKEGNWKGYVCSVKSPKLPLKPIKAYNVPIKYDENKGLDNIKSFNGLQ